MYSVQELYLHLLSTELHSVEFISTRLVSSTFSVHSLEKQRSNNLSTKFFLRLQFLFYLTTITEFITFALTITRIPNKSFIAYAFINQSFAFTPAFIIIQTLFCITNTTVKSTFTLKRLMSFYASCFISSWH